MLINLIFGTYGNKRDQEFKDSLSYTENFSKPGQLSYKTRTTKKEWSVHLIVCSIIFHSLIGCILPAVWKYPSLSVLINHREYSGTKENCLETIGILWTCGKALIAERENEWLECVCVCACVLWKHWNLLGDWMCRKAKRKEAGVG